MAFSFAPPEYKVVMGDLTNAALGLHQAAGLLLPTTHYAAGRRLRVTQRRCVSRATAAREKDIAATSEHQRALEKRKAIWMPLEQSRKELDEYRKSIAETKAAKGQTVRITRRNTGPTPLPALADRVRLQPTFFTGPTEVPVSAAEQLRQQAVAAAAPPTTITSKGIAANLGRAIRGEQNVGPRAYNLPAIQRRVAEQRAALPAAVVEEPPAVISKLNELRRIINTPIATANETGETELQRQVQRSAVLAQAQKALEAELAKLTPAQRAEYAARNAQRVAALSSTQKPPSSQSVSFSPLQSRRR